MQLPSNEENLKKQVRTLEYISIAWEVLESAAAIIAGLLAGSVSLVGFGLDSFIEIFASGVVLWELNGKDEKREKLSLRLIGTGYFLVAGYILWDTLMSLQSHHHAQSSLIGIVFLAATLIIMFGMSWKKRTLGKKTNNKTLLAEANFSLIDSSLAGVVLIGLLLNSLFGWWWADDVMALLVAGFAIKEGIEGWIEQ